MPGLASSPGSPAPTIEMKMKRKVKSTVVLNSTNADTK